MSRHSSQISISPGSSSIADAEPIFPKKLPILEVGPIYDESGFTLNERLALRQAWKLIKPFERRYGKEIYFNFLMDNYKTFEYFRIDGKLDLSRLHGHALAFMRFISAVIDQNDPVVFQAMLNDNYMSHHRCRVEHRYMQMMIKALIDHVLTKLAYVSSAALERGFQRLIDKFNAFYEKPDPKGISFPVYGRNVKIDNASISSLS